MKLYKLILLLFLLPVIGRSQNPFTPGNIVVYRIGDGNTLIDGNAVNIFLDEYTTAGVLVQSIQMPAGATGTKLTGLRDDFGGMLTLSTNGKFLMVPGYDIAVGAAFPGPRTIAKVDFNGYVVSTTPMPTPTFLPCAP